MPLVSLFERLPLEEAMPRLVEGSLQPVTGPLAVLAEETAEGLPPAKQALVWLYIDDLERAHNLCQDDSSEMGSLLHAIVHRREGDFSNARYWLMRAGSLADEQSKSLVERVKATRGDEPELLSRQREEWKRLWDRD
ncbi:hypothetical protein EON81_15680 [bacterium]|nr:MAG: hypothetical protein EON81_15680 [bacterium]